MKTSDKAENTGTSTQVNDAGKTIDESAIEPTVYKLASEAATGEGGLDDTNSGSSPRDTGNGNPSSGGDDSTQSNPYLPRLVQLRLENHFGQDFSNVNIYKNSAKALKAGALAYAYGNSISFAPNQFNPYSKEGQKLLIHELAHVVQQREGRATPSSSTSEIRLLEDEADNFSINSYKYQTESDSLTVNKPIHQYKYREIKKGDIGDIRAWLKVGFKEAEMAEKAYDFMVGILVKDKAIRQFLNEYRDIGTGFLTRLKNGDRLAHIKSLFTPKLAGVNDIGLEKIAALKSDEKLDSAESIWDKHFDIGIEQFLYDHQLDKPEFLTLDLLEKYAKIYSAELLIDDPESDDKFEDVNLDIGLLRLLNRIEEGSKPELWEKPAEDERYFAWTLMHSIDKFGISPKGYHKAKVKRAQELRKELDNAAESDKPRIRAELKQELKDRSDPLAAHLINYLKILPFESEINNLDLSTLQQHTGRDLFGLDFADGSSIDQIKFSMARKTFSAKAAELHAESLFYIQNSDLQIFADNITASDLDFGAKITGENGQRFGRLKPKDELVADISLKSDILLEMGRAVWPESTYAFEAFSVSGLTFKYKKRIGPKYSLKPGMATFIAPLLGSVVPASFALIAGYVSKFKSQLSKDYKVDNSLAQALSLYAGNGESLEISFDGAALKNLISINDSTEEIDGEQSPKEIPFIRSAELGPGTITAESETWDAARFTEILDQSDDDTESRQGYSQFTLDEIDEIKDWKSYQAFKRRFVPRQSRWAILREKKRLGTLPKGQESAYKQLKEMHDVIKHFEQYRESEIRMETFAIPGQENEAVLELKGNKILGDFLKQSLKEAIADPVAGFGIELEDPKKLGDFDITEFFFSANISPAKARQGSISAEDGAALDEGPIPTETMHVEILVPSVEASKIGIKSPQLNLSANDPELINVRGGITFTLPLDRKDNSAYKLIAFEPFHIEALKVKDFALDALNGTYSLVADEAELNNIILGYNFMATGGQDAFMLSLGKINFVNGTANIDGQSMKLNNGAMDINTGANGLNLAISDDKEHGYDDWLHFSRSADGTSQRIKVKLPQAIKLPGLEWSFANGVKMKLGSTTQPAELSGIVVDVEISPKKWQINEVSVGSLDVNTFVVDYEGYKVVANDLLQIKGLSLQNFAVFERENWQNPKSLMPLIDFPVEWDTHSEMTLDETDEAPKHSLPQAEYTTDQPISLPKQPNSNARRLAGKGSNASTASFSWDDLTINGVSIYWTLEDFDNEVETSHIEHFDWEKFKAFSNYDNNEYDVDQLQYLFRNITSGKRKYAGTARIGNNKFHGIEGDLGAAKEGQAFPFDPDLYYHFKHYVPFVMLVMLMTEFEEEE